MKADFKEPSDIDVPVEELSVGLPYCITFAFNSFIVILFSIHVFAFIKSIFLLSLLKIYNIVIMYDLYLSNSVATNFFDISSDFITLLHNI